MIKDDKTTSMALPQCATDYIDLVARKVRYRRTVRREVREELAGHFEDALHGITDEQQRTSTAMKLIKEFGDPGTLATLIRRGKKRCRPLWLRALIRCTQAAAVTFACLVAFAFWFFSGKPYITVDYVAELNTLERPLVDSSLNAWSNYEKAFRLTVEEPKGLPYPSQEPNDPNEEAKIRDWVGSNDSALDEVLRGYEKPHRWRRYESKTGALMDIYIPWLPQYKDLVHSMLWKARFAADAGDMQTAIQWLGRSIESQSKILSRRFVVEQLVSLAVMSMTTEASEVIIRRHQLSSRDMEAMQRMFESGLNEFDFRLSLGGERTFIEDTVQRTFTATGLIAPEDTLRRVISLDPESNLRRRYVIGDKMSLAEALPGWLGHGKVLFVTKGQTLRDAQRFMDEAQKVMDMTPYEARRAGTSPGLLAASMKEQNPYLGMLLGGWSQSTQVLYVNRAKAQACPVIIAAHRYKLDKGVWPEGMEQLQQAGYIKTIPPDPWSDKSLAYRRTEDGFTLYSLGPDFTDDGGVHVPWPKRKSPGMIYNDPEDFKGDLVYWPIPSTEKRQW